MAIHIQMRDGVIEATFRGNVAREDLRQLIETLRDLESRLQVTPDRISDLSDASFAELSSSDLVTFAANRGRAALKNNIKSAIIAPGAIQFGLARMFMAHNQNPAIEIMIFKDSASAYHWIGLEKTVNQPNA
jgi:hypothetical protein